MLESRRDLGSLFRLFTRDRTTSYGEKDSVVSGSKNFREHRFKVHTNQENVFIMLTLSVCLCSNGHARVCPQIMQT